MSQYKENKIKASKLDEIFKKAKAEHVTIFNVVLDGVEIIFNNQNGTFKVFDE